MITVLPGTQYVEIPPYQLPERVAAFLATYIASAAELQLLVALIDGPDRWWDSVSASREIGLPVSLMSGMLDRFAKANLLDIRVTDAVRYRLRPGTPELEQDLAGLREAWRFHPAAVMQVVAQSARRSIRDFADAFRFKRDGSS